MLMITPNKLFAEIIGSLQLYSIIEPAYVYRNDFSRVLKESENKDIKGLLKDSLGKYESESIKGKIKRFKKEKEYNQAKTEELIDELFGLSLRHLLSYDLYNVLKEELKELMNNYSIFYNQCEKIEGSELNTFRTRLLSISSFFKVKNSLSKLNRKYENHKIMVTDKDNILSGMVTNKTIKKFITRDPSLISRDNKPKKYPLIKTSTIFTYKIECHINSDKNSDIFSDEHQEIIDYIFLARLNWIIKKEIFKGTNFYYLLDPKELFVNIMNTYTLMEIYKGLSKRGGEWLLDYNHYFNPVYKDSQELVEKNLKFLILWIKIIKRKFSKYLSWLSFLSLLPISEKIEKILEEISDEDNSLPIIEKKLKELLESFYKNNLYENEVTELFFLLTSQKGLAVINLVLLIGEKFNNYEKKQKSLPVKS